MRADRKLDMTQGNVYALALRFAVPLCIGKLLQQLYLTIDKAVVGQFCGAASLAALAASSNPVELLLHLFLGLGSGMSILVAQYTGSGEKERTQRLLGTATGFLYLCAAAVTVLGLAAGPWILSRMQTPAEVIPPALSYLRIIFLGSIASLGYNMNAGVLRGLGDSRSSLLFLLLSCLSNVLLDVLFVAVLGMDTGGAALATVIAQFLSWGASIAYIRKRYPELELPLIPRRGDAKILHEITRISIPLGINNSLYAVGHLLIQALINAQGAAFIAGCSIGSSVLELANVGCSSLSMAATTYAGQNLGAGRYDRVKMGARIPLFSGMISLITSALMIAFAHPVLRIFTSDPAVTEAALMHMHIVQPYICLYTVFAGIVALVNGIGEVRYPTAVNLIMLWGIRIPLGHLIVRFFDGRYVLAAVPISFTLGLIAMLFFYRSKKWKDILRMAEKQIAV